jgi:opacity protein-like surface antigen
MEPVSGGLISPPVYEAPGPTMTAPLESPAPAPAPVAAATAPGDDTRWGLLLRGGAFNLPNSIADELFVKHPDVTGPIVGAEIRYHGKDGGRGVASIGLAVDYLTTTSYGEWQYTKSTQTMTGDGTIDMLSITLTGYWSLFPSWYVHPYVGLGIGVAHATGKYEDNEDRNQWVSADYWVPAVHVPVGLAIELGKGFQLSIEGRFIDGISLGGAIQARF